METNILLSPQQLFYLGSILHATYIDYSYITALGVIENGYKILEPEIKSELSSSGLISEDFSGNIVVKDDLKELLEPVFQGTNEVSIEVCSIGSNTIVESYKYHAWKEQISRVYFNGEKFEICKSSSEDILRVFNSLIPEDYSSDKEMFIENIDVTKASQVIALKTAHTNKMSKVKNFFKYEGTLLTEDNNNVIKSLDKDQFVEECSLMIKEVI